MSCQEGEGVSLQEHDGLGGLDALATLRRTQKELGMLAGRRFWVGVLSWVVLCLVSQSCLCMKGKYIYCDFFS